MNIYISGKTVAEICSRHGKILYKWLSHSIRRSIDIGFDLHRLSTQLVK
jgi:hypothetical protein